MWYPGKIEVGHTTYDRAVNIKFKSPTSLVCRTIRGPAYSFALLPELRFKDYEAATEYSTYASQ